MKRNTLLAFALLLAAAVCSSSQVPVATGIQILRAEDARRYDKSLEDLMASPKADVRSGAALAAGRIGDEKALTALTTLLDSDNSDDVAAMAAFAIGEIESVKGADAVLKVLKEKDTADVVRARAVEAAGKIAAANPRDAAAKTLGEAIIATLEKPDYDREIVLPALTAALRARPEKAAEAVAKYLTSPDGRVRADAANTLSRLRAKNANAPLRRMLESETDDVARANAARALGAAEDKDAAALLIAAATGDVVPRVRVSAITSLATLRDAKAVDPLLARGEALLAEYKKNTRPNHIGDEHSEFLVIATALGRLLANSANERAVKLLRDFGNIDKGHSPEAYIARVRIDQRRGDYANPPDMSTWQQHSTLAQIIGEFAVLEPTTDDGKKMKAEAPTIFAPLARAIVAADPAVEGKRMMAAPDVLRAYARFKTADLAEIARIALVNKDVQLRAAAAGVLDDLPATRENVDALKTAFAAALVTDKRDNDAQLAIMGSIFTLDKKESIGVLTTALGAQDYLVRKRAFDLLKTVDVKDAPGVPAILENARKQDKDKVLKYNPALGTKLGQVLNTDIDYRRALSRKNGSIKAVLKTDKGTFTINFFPEEAPLTVDNFVKLARTGYFNGLAVHRVVANFVMQDGDPRGDGNGGPGWSIRCEVNTREYGRGAVGMALSGKDTGGSQWFVTHAPQPHLDGGYTVFGQVSDKDMDVVDKIVRGDKIISVRIVGR